MQRRNAWLQRPAQTAHGWSIPAEPSSIFSFVFREIARAAVLAACSFV
jgi:hypothetical protein